MERNDICYLAPSDHGLRRRSPRHFHGLFSVCYWYYHNSHETPLVTNNYCEHNESSNLVLYTFRREASHERS